MTGTFGHSAVYDQSSGLIFVHGGFSLLVDSVETKKKVSSALFSFSPSKKTWYVNGLKTHRLLLLYQM